MRFRVQVVVTLKDGLLDPQGKTVEGALPTLGWENVGPDVRVASVEVPSRRKVKATVVAWTQRGFGTPQPWTTMTVPDSGRS